MSEFKFDCLFVRFCLSCCVSNMLLFIVCASSSRAHATRRRSELHSLLQCFLSRNGKYPTHPIVTDWTRRDRPTDLQDILFSRFLCGRFKVR